jgi:hypothetical protein
LGIDAVSRLAIGKTPSVFGGILQYEAEYINSARVAAFGFVTNQAVL